MALGAAAADDVTVVCDPGQDGRKPLATLHDRAGLRCDLRRVSKNMQSLGPEPLGTVDTTLIHGRIHIGSLAGGVDLLRLLDRRVVFPEDEHGIRIGGIFLAHGERSTCRIGERRSGTRCVKGYSNYIGSHFRSAFGQGVLDSELQNLKVILGMLSPLVGLRIAVKSP